MPEQPLTIPAWVWIFAALLLMPLAAVVAKEYFHVRAGAHRDGPSKEHIHPFPKKASTRSEPAAPRKEPAWEGGAAAKLAAELAAKAAADAAADAATEMQLKSAELATPEPSAGEDVPPLSAVAADVPVSAEVAAEA